MNSWHGKLHLTYGSHGGKTQLVSSQNQAPLKVQRPFYPEGEAVCHSIILHTAGGVVGGDRLSTNIHLQPQSQVLLTTAAASKIYKSNGLQARQDVTIHIDSHACLEYLPQETIVFNSANYRQDVRIHLAVDASFLGWEITRFGRTARNEQFIQGEWRNYTEIWRDNQPLWIDRQYLPGDMAVFHSPHGLNSQAIAGSFIYLGKQISPQLITQIRQMWGENSPSAVGVTALEHGFLCRYRGNSTSEVRNWFISVWQLLRQSIGNRGNCVPRVWQI
ncbi:urease accessory protein UreD [Calothrix sp. 336/3]|uniref:urease accessory protein UreD n=1 Tax=Calothrix sp. 336/3 TaxID=1337936 RepID=UPI001EDCBE21|nr:urease accessory protein UreD [Calothrix sp. 336/3]